MLAPRGDGGYQSLTPHEYLINYDEPRTQALAELPLPSLDGMAKPTKQHTVKLWGHFHSEFWRVWAWAPHLTTLLYLNVSETYNSCLLGLTFGSWKLSWIDNGDYFTKHSLKTYKIVPPK